MNTYYIRRDNYKFDYEFYISKYKDLKGLNNKIALLHYTNNGKFENRVCFNVNKVIQNILYFELKNNNTRVKINNKIFDQLDIIYEYISTFKYIDVIYFNNELNNEPSDESNDESNDESSNSEIPLISEKDHKIFLKKIRLKILDKYTLCNNLNNELLNNIVLNFNSDWNWREKIPYKYDVVIEIIYELKSSKYLLNKKINLEDIFDYNEFTAIYKHYKSVFPSNIHAQICFENFKTHAYRQQLIPNKIFYELIEINQKYLQNIEMLRLNNFPFLSKKKKFIIITRTHNRKSLFLENYNKIKNQTIYNNSQIHQQIHQQIVHVVSYDNYNTLKYIPVDTIKINLSGLKKIKTHPNLYFDHIYNQLNFYRDKNYWILFLDDDDILQSNNSLEILSNFIEHNENLLIWKFYRNDKYIHPNFFSNDMPIVGEIATCNYTFHISKYKTGKWKANSIGDFDFFKYLYSQYETQNILKLDYAFTGVNYKGYISGNTAN